MLNQSVGFMGVNKNSDVRFVQGLLKHQGFSHLVEDGICGPKTINAIRNYQSAFMLRPDGLVSVGGKTIKHLTLKNTVKLPSSHPIIYPPTHPISGPLTVRFGQVTFDAEGNDLPNSIYFSRVVHWPQRGESGVTIGRGYDIGGRTENIVVTDLRRAGVPDEQSQMIAKGAKMKGKEASDFVKQFRYVIGEISHDMQIRLFELIYPDYLSRARLNYEKWTSTYSKKVSWDSLDGIIRDVLVDFVYQGFTKGSAPMVAGMNNSVDELINYIEHSAVMQSYENGRHRVNYLRNNRK